ncbi:MAG: ABC transporter permease [Spirochaetaceae bacterium]|nr:ABC transporter permease [Spirochaetaceae bacterium]
MNYREDLRMSVRSVIGRPAESLLLSLGVALAVGATAAGIALAGRTNEQSRELLSAPRYREIVVAAREDADEMDLPAQVQTSTEVSILTAADLEARSVTQAIQYAYLANRTGFWFGESGFRQGGGGQNQSEGQNQGQGTQGQGTQGQGAQGQGTQTQTQAQGQAGQGGQASSGQSGGGRAAEQGEGGQAGQRQPGQGQQVQAQGQTQGQAQGQQAQGQQAQGQQAQGQQADASTAASPEVVAPPEGPQPQIDFVEGWEVTPEFFAAWGLAAAEGDVFQASDVDRGEPLLVLGSTLGSTLFEDGESVGRQVLSRNQLYRIIGVLEPSGTEVDSLAFSPAVIAAGQFQGFGGRFRALRTNLRFMVEDPDQLEEARAQLVNWFDSSHGVGAVAISVPREEAEATADRNGRLATVILFLALSALLIAAVNVTNIFFSRAVRKRRTVGILKAVGASIRQVFTVFFLEALAIGAVGAAVGLGLSALLSRLMEETIGFGALQIGLIVVGVLVSWGIVAVFNVVPASAAARVPAAEAIRYE